jgi:hypothetical protein
VRVLYGLPFPKRARFIYLEDQFGTDEYWMALRRAIDESNPAYAAALAGVRARGGILPRAHFDVASGSPVLQKGHIASAKVLERLVSVRLLSCLEVDGYGECVTLNEEGPFGRAERASMRARLITEDILIGAMRSWAGRMNLASPNVITVRGETRPKFSTFNFDICGPCYLRPMRRHRDQAVDPGFFVADVVLGSILEEEHVKPFLRKCQSLAFLRDVRPFLPMLIADGFSPEALRACRAEGIIATTAETLFGRDVGRALGDLMQTLTHAAAVAARDPKKLESLFSRLGAVEGAATNLRGALFELIVGHMVRSIEGGSIDIGEEIREMASNLPREMDVRLVRERTVTIYECKGYQPGTVVGGDEISAWLNHKVPIVYNAHREQQRFDGCEIGFEFWTRGSFDPKALALLETAQKKTRKYRISWKDGADVRAYAKGMKSKGLRKTLNEHYFAHPLAKLVPASKSPAIEFKAAQDKFAAREKADARGSISSDMDDFEDLEDLAASA